MQIITIDPKLCTRWQGADRAGFEFGDIYALSKDIQKNGQVEPVIVRPSTHTDFKYEIITGSRRWKACLDASIPLKAIVKDLKDEEALLTQIKENEKMSICDYSKGMSYHNSIENKITTHDKLADILGISPRKLYNFLTFAKIPQSIWDAVGNLSRVSSKVADKIYTLSNKGDEYIKALIEIAGDLRIGAGANTIEKKVIKIVQGKKPDFVSTKKIQLSNGQIIAHWTKDGIKFEKGLNFDQEQLANLLMRYFEKLKN